MQETDVRTPISYLNGDWVQKFGPIWKTQTETLKAKFGAAIEEVLMPPEAATDMVTVFVKKESIVLVLQFLKDEPGFEYVFLSDITATDEMEFRGNPRFDVVYHLYALFKGPRIRIKVRVAENEDVPTAVSVWPAANWAEREIFDMFGVRFRGHPDLRRILMDERWVGHPLRKDYPLRGYQIFPSPMEANPKLLED